MGVITGQEGNNHKAFDNIAIAVSLSLLGGFLDAYSYLLKGGVFANAQTGNVVLLFISLANTEFARCIKYIIPIITFALGILASELFKGRKEIKSHLRIKIVLLIEFALIIGIALAGDYFSNYVINCAISLLAGIQVANFDKFDGNPIATTMITGNLKSGMISLSKYIHTGNKDAIGAFLRYSLVIASFGFGVFIGCISIKLFSGKSICICALFIALSYIAIIKEEKKPTPSAA
jgi:uncharacterized membrane protein YoaK (UPF0700 family)